MIHAIEDINVIPFKKVIKKNNQYRKTGLFPIDNEIKILSEKRHFLPEQPEFPFDEWTTPTEPHGYIKGRDNDFL